LVIDGRAIGSDAKVNLFDIFADFVLGGNADRARREGGLIEARGDAAQPGFGDGFDTFGADVSGDGEQNIFGTIAAIQIRLEVLATEGADGLFGADDGLSQRVLAPAIFEM
jgi:hypothetical protein